MNVMKITIEKYVVEQDTRFAMQFVRLYRQHKILCDQKLQLQQLSKWQWECFKLQLLCIIL